jgi:hypothetical protein
MGRYHGTPVAHRFLNDRVTVGIYLFFADNIPGAMAGEECKKNQTKAYAYHKDEGKRVSGFLFLVSCSSGAIFSLFAQALRKIRNGGSDLKNQKQETTNQKLPPYSTNAYL